jgi:hypothetical protein
MEASRCSVRRRRLERFSGPAQIDFLRPNRRGLPMEAPVGLSDRIGSKQAGLTLLGDPCRLQGTQAIAVDAAVDHRMRDMDSEWSVFARHALANHPQTRLRGGEVSITWLAAEAAGCSCKEHGATPQWHEPACRFSPDQEACKATHPPEVLE